MVELILLQKKLEGDSKYFKEFKYNLISRFWMQILEKTRNLISKTNIVTYSY